MGFYDNIIDIIKLLPTKKQTLLFSATYPNEIAEISQLIQKNPIEITVESKEDIPNIAQLAFQAREHEKNDAVIALLAHYNPESTIIFCKTKSQCDDVAIFLCEKGYHALAIHSDFEQHEREEVLLQFANRSCSILVATDVAARGLDIKDLPLVINYDLPSSPEMYVHRIGRTGRGGKSGFALSLYAFAENFKIEAIEAFTQIAITKIEKASLDVSNHVIAQPAMRTLCIHGGKKNKIRPGDILGALTGEGGLTADQVGKIDIFDFHTYVAINREVASKVLNNLQDGKIKGRSFKMRYL
jgi:ATP-independent RNA helicase DbpA